MLRLLIDENIDHRILRGLLRRMPQLDFIIPTRAGLAGLADPALLRWAAREDRTILTHDVQTMPYYAKQLVAQAEPMAGVIVIPDRVSNRSCNCGFGVVIRVPLTIRPARSYYAPAVVI
jgi:hypothetical protein